MENIQEHKVEQKLELNIAVPQIKQTTIKEYISEQPALLPSFNIQLDFKLDIPPPTQSNPLQDYRR